MYGHASKTCTMIFYSSINSAPNTTTNIIPTSNLSAFAFPWSVQTDPTDLQFAPRQAR